MIGFDSYIDQTSENKRTKKKKRSTKNADLNETVDDLDKASIISDNSPTNMIIDDKSSIHSDLSNTMVFERNEREKLYRRFMVPKRRTPVSMYSNDHFLRVCCNAFAYHRLNSAAKLMPALIKDKRTAHMFIIKAAFALFTQNTSDPSLLVQSMRKLSKFGVNKQEIMLEVILYFIRIGDKVGAKQYIDSNESTLRLPFYHDNSVIHIYLKCYICYVDYLEWKQSIEESNDNIVYHSNRLIAEKTKLSLKNIITETKNLILDYFVLILIEMYEYSQQFEEAVDVLKVYIVNNPNHLNAYIYLYNFGLKYHGYLSPEFLTNTLKEIHRYSPENPLVLDMVRNNDQIVDKFEILMELIDHRQHFDDITIWTQLKDLLISVKDKSVRKQLKKLWKNVYRNYWTRLHCSEIKMKEINENVIELIRCKQKVIEFFYSSSHPFVIQTNQKIDEYQSLINFC